MDMVSTIPSKNNDSVKAKINGGDTSVEKKLRMLPLKRMIGGQ